MWSQIGICITWLPTSKHCEKYWRHVSSTHLNWAPNKLCGCFYLNCTMFLTSKITFPYSPSVNWILPKFRQPLVGLSVSGIVVFYTKDVNMFTWWMQTVFLGSNQCDKLVLSNKNCKHHVLNKVSHYFEVLN